MIINLGADVNISAGRLQRTVNLPRILLQSNLERYYYENDTLRLEFREKPSEVEEEIAWEDDPFFANSGMK
jgi:hypothetical protein